MEGEALFVVGAQAVIGVVLRDWVLGRGAVDGDGKQQARQDDLLTC